mmetsp:Transcript_13522/g.20300  ORF Transcript_13522/g.20300 Transcript_13522/m.20300 type:complete len:572 (-) Transcript_13522:262-1977(-)
MAAGETGWLVSDSIKAALAFAQVVYAVLQIKSPTKATPKRHLHYAALWNAILLLGLFLQLHGGYSDSYERLAIFHVLFIALAKTSLIVSASYLAYTLHRAVHRSSRIAKGVREEVAGSVAGKSSHLPWYILGFILLFVSLVISLVLTFVLEDYFWMSLRDFGEAVALAIIGPYIAGSFWKFFRKIRSLQKLQTSEAKNKRNITDLEAHYTQIKSHMKVMTSITIAIVSLALGSAIFHGVEAAKTNKTYKEKFKENSKNYDPVEDVTLFIALAANFYFQYYARVKTRICGKKSAISQQALDSKRSVQVFNTAGPKGSFRFTSRGFIMKPVSPKSKGPFQHNFSRTKTPVERKTSWSPGKGSSSARNFHASATQSTQLSPGSMWSAARSKSTRMLMAINSNGNSAATGPTQTAASMRRGSKTPPNSDKDREDSYNLDARSDEHHSRSRTNSRTKKQQELTSISSNFALLISRRGFLTVDRSPRSSTSHSQYNNNVVFAPPQPTNGQHRPHPRSISGTIQPRSSNSSERSSTKISPEKKLPDVTYYSGNQRKKRVICRQLSAGHLGTRSRPSTK